MSYKRQANANRDALFGPAGGGGGGSSKTSKSKPRSNAASRDALFGDTTAKKSSSRPSSSAPAARPLPTTRTVLTANKKGGKLKKPALQGDARATKLTMAQDFRDKANKCMQTSFFTKPDPVAASTYYKRAADAYQQVGDEDRMERLYRLESAKCNMQIGAWASAATDYTRAAVLLVPKDTEVDDLPEAPDYPTIEKRRTEASMYHKQASLAYAEMNEKAKAAQSQVQAAIVLNYGDESRLLSKESLTQLEEAIEAHIPDLFNPYARYRQTGNSAFLGEDETIANPSRESLDMAEAHVVSKAYAHEPLFELVYLMVHYGEYASALYAAGAASTLLERENLSTLTLSRSYIMETIVTLAMGDPVAAEEAFLSRHVQKTAYLSSRECKLGEDLFRAVKMRDSEALEETRSPSGSNRAALANLHSSLRTLVGEIRLSGVARKQVKETTTATGSSSSKKASPKKSSKKGGKSSKPKEEPPTEADPRSLQELMGMKTGYEADMKAGQTLDPDALANELDALDFDMGDDGDDDGDLGFGGDDDSLDDDDFDLR